MIITIVTDRILESIEPPWNRPPLTLGDVFGNSANEKKIRAIHKKSPSHLQAKKIAEVIKPRLPVINKLAGQEMDATYLAYYVIHILNQINK